MGKSDSLDSAKNTILSLNVSDASNPDIIRALSELSVALNDFYRVYKFPTNMRGKK